MTLEDIRTYLETRIRTLQGQQLQYAAQANAAAGALELCQELATLLKAPPAGADPPG